MGPSLITVLLVSPSRDHFVSAVADKFSYVVQVLMEVVPAEQRAEGSART
jgi:hypothetical protein